jgi:hypothetical protein
VLCLTRRDVTEAAVTSERAKEYRRRAQECLAVARTVSNLQRRASLEAIAQAWFRLADQHAAIRPPTESSPTQPVGQQQQQPQPDDDENKE